MMRPDGTVLGDGQGVVGGAKGQMASWVARSALVIDGAPITGDLKGTWSLHVTRNRRLTFQIDDEIIDINLEDYH